jgi:hypothetical protein
VNKIEANSDRTPSYLSILAAYSSLLLRTALTCNLVDLTEGSFEPNLVIGDDWQYLAEDHLAWNLG